MKPVPSSLAAKPLQITIESLGGLGDGIATFDGKPLFVAKSCAGDVLDILITHENREGRQGVITSIITPGPDRVTPPCAYFPKCGGCKLQHLSPASYQAFKTRMLHSALEYAGFPLPSAEVIFLQAGKRRRVEFSVSHQHGRASLGFNEMRTNTPVAVGNCMVLEPAMQSLITPVNGALAQLNISDIKSVSLTNADNGIDIMITLRNDTIMALPEAMERLGAARISVKLANETTHILYEKSAVVMKLGDYTIPLPPDAFLQATKEGEQRLTDIVMKGAQSATSIVDLFCGIGTYSFPLSRKANVLAVEGSPSMIKTINTSIKTHDITSLSAQQRDLFKNPLSVAELKRFDAAVINPPRVGAKNQTEQLAKSSISTVVMISCNPATFSRDARILKDSGFSLVQAQGIDQFVYSQHLEIAAVFTR